MNRPLSASSPSSAETVRTIEHLVTTGLVPASARPELERVAERYAVALTPHVMSLIDRSDPDDPIARQYVPDASELDTLSQERDDPIGDHVHSPVPGIVHRYPDRVLLKLVHVCAVYCRFCFRREMVGPGKETGLSPDAYARALDYIRRTPQIWEVILTGGDPLMLSPRRLAGVMADLDAIPHVKVVRLHTRIPVADPARVTDEMVAALRTQDSAVWVALHANHPRELTGDAKIACARVIDAGIPMVSQSVLLSGVNDDPATLEALMRAFVECRIKPYYLHHGDLAPGTAHLRTSIEKGQQLVATLRGHVSGLCQPDYVLDIPGGYGKTPISRQMWERAVEDADAVRYRIRDYCGDIHIYPPG